MEKKAKNNEDFYIVGVGGSAGGFSAFKEFLQNISDNPKIAFVIVQHLLPEAESHLSELLSAVTHLTVAQVTDGCPIKPGHVYIIPPNTQMLVEKNKLQLSPRRKDHMNTAIDIFFLSLAKYKKQNAIGIILSGAGTDGTLGLKAIKEAGGITFAQDQSAQFKSMPESAAAAGIADYVMSPADIAKKIMKIDEESEKQHFASDTQQQEHEITPEEGADLQEILSIVHRSSDVDFTYYKTGTIKRRIMRRMLLNTIQSYRDYVDYLKNNPKESESLYRDILIHVTDFFRDREIFDHLEKNVFPNLLESRSSIRIWIPGCSTGEEVYSYAIILAELREKSGTKIPIQIFGTDLSEVSLQTARHGIYPKTIKDSVPPALLRKYFIEINGQYQISKEIRAMCVFAKHNMVADIPFSKLDIISCRNVLIYLDSYLQKKAFPIFHYALNPDGLLILGTAETAGNFQDMFKQADGGHRIYTKKSTPHRPTFEFPLLRMHGKLLAMPVPAANTNNPHVNIEQEADEIFRKRNAGAGIIINEDLTIIQFRGDVTPYLSPASGRATLDLLKMAHKSFLPKILELMVRAKKETAAVQQTYQLIKTEIEIIPLANGAFGEKYFFILFIPIGSKSGARKTAAKKAAKTKSSSTEITEALALQNELSSTIEQLQAVIEARDSSNEELRSAHEEVMSANEELQSTNEELETTKEELQSTNEELMTLNTELENRNADLVHHARELYRKDEFLSFLGHELRNPLSPIVHALELIQLRGIEDAELKDMFDIISRQTKVLNDIIKNLLDAARAISGKIDLQKELVNFDTVLDHAIETVQPIITANKHTLEIKRPANPVSLLIDPGRVEQIIVNVLTNAAKYTKQGGHITLTAAQEGGKMVISIKDNGIGIPPEVLPRIFSLFFQGDQSLSNFKGGLGVGLVLSSTLAKLHGGNLIAKSEGLGRGSEFILELPIHRSSGSDRNIRHLDIKDLKLEKRRVMIVDDNVELADVFAQLLRRLDQDVAVVYSGDEAIEKARADAPEIIFIDVAMPNMSGYELLELLRKEPALKKTRFVALSGFGKEYTQKSLDAGFDEHVIKPVAPAELHRILSQI